MPAAPQCSPRRLWPAQPIRFVVPFAPGGSADFVARSVAQRSGVRLLPPLVIENRLGAGATQGSALAGAAAPAAGAFSPEEYTAFVRSERRAGSRGARFRRGRRCSGAAGQHTTITTRAPAGRARDATKPRRNPA